MSSQASIPAAAAVGTAVATGPEPPLKDVLVELWANLEKLVRQEIALASAELDQKTQKLKADLVAIAAGGALILAGALALVATVILVLALFLPAWAAALITGSVATGAGLALVRSNKPTVADIKPERTMRSLEKSIHTFKEPTR